MSHALPGVAGNLSRIQELVDGLARELGRSVAVDTPAFEVVCASAQIGAIDDRRIDSIIHRSPPPEPVPWLLSHGIRESRTPVRLPANPEFGMLPRVCFPVRKAGMLRAYLWLFDQPRLSMEEIAGVADFAEVLAELFVDDEGARSDRAETLAALAADILGGREGSLNRAREGGLLPAEGALSVHVVQLRAAGTATDPAESDPARRLQYELSRLHRRRPFLSTVEAGELLLVERGRFASDTSRVLDEVRRAGIVSGVAVTAIGSAGIAGPDSARTAVRRARFLAAVAALPGSVEPQLYWEEAGAWRLLIGWELSDATVRTLSEDAWRLLLAGGRGYWSTVLAFLDFGRNTNRTAGQLFIHRATLHYRLERAREILGEGVLEDGWRAGALHVALRLHAALQEAPAG